MPARQFSYRIRGNAFPNLRDHVGNRHRGDPTLLPPNAREGDHDDRSEARVCHVLIVAHPIRTFHDRGFTQPARLPLFGPNSIEPSPHRPH